MRVLVYGAGVLGSYLAHVLFNGGNETTVLARGKRFEELSKNGLIIRHYVQCKTTVDKVNIIGELAKDDVYDLIFVVMQCTQLQAVLPILAENNSQHIIFVGNNTDGQATYNYIQKNSSFEKKIAFGFQATGGRRENGRVICVRARGQMELGGLNGQLSWRGLIDKAFENTKYKLTYIDNMDAWHKSHLALIMPLAYAAYACDGNLHKAAKNKKLLKQIVNATIEGYKVIEAAGYQPTPKKEAKLICEKSKLYYLMLKIVTATPIGKLAISDHAMSAVGEMVALEEALNKLKHQVNLATPNLDALQVYMKKL